MASKTTSIQTMLFNKSLSTMVKGIRAHKDEESEYIAKCLSEIKDELKSAYADVKATALQKLIYLQLLGYDMSWAAFNITEVMSAPWFAHKRIGYLSAQLCFTKDTDVILLTTHLFRKGFTQSQTANTNVEGLQYETGAAISCLSTIATPQLARDLLSDVYGMLNSSRPYVRKKAVLVLLKIFKQWPKALRLSFDRLKEKLKDEHPGVVSAAVYVLCELAMKNPKNYLALAPSFFKILTTSTNNWVLIKVVKLLGALVPLEPRLAKKLSEPLVDIITTTPAKSLLYECVNTLLLGRLTSKSVIRLCLDKLKSFIEDADQNLKYLGLLGLHKLMKKHPKIVAEHKDLIIACLDDSDITIRTRALDLITSMVSQRNIGGIVRKLMEHLESSDGQYRDVVLERILFICSQENFAFVSDFEWYISVLVELTHVAGVNQENAERISQQLMDVTIRVPAVRRYSVQSMASLIVSGRLLSASSSFFMGEVLFAAAFICGEFSEYIDDHSSLIAAMLRPEVCQLSSGVQQVFLQSLMKLLSVALLQPMEGEKYVDWFVNYDALRDEEEKKKKKKAEEDEKQRKEEDEEKRKRDAEEEEEEEDADKKNEQDQDNSALDLTDDDDESGAFTDDGIRKLRIRPKKRAVAEWQKWMASIVDLFNERLPLFTSSNAVEVQERAVSYQKFLQWLTDALYIKPFLAKKDTKETQNDGQEKGKPEKVAEPVQTTADVLALSDDKSKPPAPAAAPSAVSSSGSSVSDKSPPMDDASLRERIRVVTRQFGSVYSERLNPVNPKAQKKVAVPKGLDLEKEINKDWAEESESSEEEDEENDRRSKKKKGKKGKKAEDDESDLPWKDEEDAEVFGHKKKKEKKSKKDAGKGFDPEELTKPPTKEEIEESSRRLADRKKALENDIFHIKDRPNANTSLSSASYGAATPTKDSSSAALDVNSIPIVPIQAGELPSLQFNDDKEKDKKKKHRRKGSGFSDEEEAKPKKPAKTYKIMTTEEMPEEDAAEDADKKKKKKGKDKKDKRAADADDSDNDLDNVDLTKPLGADEVMPKVVPYANSRQQNVDKEKEKDKEKDKDKSERKKDKKKKDKKKERADHADDEEDERKSSKEKDRKKKDKKNDSSSKKEKKEDGKKDKEKEAAETSKKDDKAKESAKPVVAAPVKEEKKPESILDLFDPIAKSPPPTPLPASSASVSASAPSSSSLNGKAEKASAKDTHSSKDDAKAPPVDEKLLKKANKLRESTLLDDSTVKIKYLAESESTSSATVRVEFVIRHHSDSPAKSLSALSIEAKSVEGVRVSAPVSLKNVSAGDSVRGSMILTLALPSAPAKALSIPVSISYTTDKGKTKEKSSAIQLPFSALMVCRACSSSEFADVLTSNTFHSSSKVFTLKKQTFDDAAKLVGAFLHVTLVELLSGKAASLYGALIAGTGVSRGQSHIAALVKAKKDNAIQVELKSALSSAVCDAILNEVEELFDS